MFKSSADIRVSRFVKISGNYTVAECDAGEFCFGISAEHSESAPLPNVSELASTSGNPVSIYDGTEPANTRQVLLMAGSGGWTAGAFLKSDADGAGVATTTSEDLYGAVAMEAASAGETGRVFILRGSIP